MPNNLIRTFQLHRDVDVSGVSGTGVVADGVEFPDGTVAIRWRGDDPSTAIWDDIRRVERIHGHGGLTRIVWTSPAPEPPGESEDEEGQSREDVPSERTAHCTT